MQRRRYHVASQTDRKNSSTPAGIAKTLLEFIKRKKVPDINDVYHFPVMSMPLENSSQDEERRKT